MAFNIMSYGKVVGRIDNTTIRAGSIEVPVSLSVTGNIHHKVATIANGANATMYADELSGFTYLLIHSDYNLRMKITDNASNTFNVTLKGTGVDAKYGIKFQLGSDDTANTSVLINALQVFNTSGNSAKCEILVIA